MKDKKQIAVLCFLSDVAISIWSYFKLTNYDEYLKLVKPMIGSPDLAVQFYKIMIQAFTFTLLLFLAFHLIIYILLLKEKKYSIKYLYYYTLMAAISALLMIFSYNAYVAIIPLIIYVLSFIALGKWLKTLASAKA